MVSFMGKINMNGFQCKFCVFIGLLPRAGSPGHVV